MSTNIPSKWTRDAHRAQVNVLVTESGFFGALNCLVEYRRSTEGLTKITLADRLGKDKATVTKLTSQPSNMKISTIACLADSLDAHVALIFIAKEDTRIIFTATGVHNCGLVQISMANAQAFTQARAFRLSQANNWIEQPRELDYA